MFLTWAASSSCPSVRGWGIPVCTSLLPPLGHEVQVGHLEKQKKKQKKSYGWQILKETFACPWWKVTEFQACSYSTCHKWLNISTDAPDDIGLSTAACFTPSRPTNISHSWCGGPASQSIPDSLRSTNAMKNRWAWEHGAGGWWGCGQRSVGKDEWVLFRRGTSV